MTILDGGGGVGTARVEAQEALEVFESAPASVSREMGVRNAAIALYFASGRADRAFALFEEMRTRGDAQEGPNTITYNTLIAACAASGKYQRARDLYGAMVASDVPRSGRTYVSLMAAAARAAPTGQGADAALEVFFTAEDDHLPPNEFLYTALMDAQVGEPVKSGRTRHRPQRERERDACACIRRHHDFTQCARHVIDHIARLRLLTTWS